MKYQVPYNWIIGAHSQSRTTNLTIIRLDSTALTTAPPPPPPTFKIGVTGNVIVLVYAGSISSKRQSYHWNNMLCLENIILWLKLSFALATLTNHIIQIFFPIKIIV